MNSNFTKIDKEQSDSNKANSELNDLQRLNNPRCNKSDRKSSQVRRSIEDIHDQRRLDSEFEL